MADFEPISRLLVQVELAAEALTQSIVTSRKVGAAASADSSLADLVALHRYSEVSLSHAPSSSNSIPARAEADQLAQHMGIHATERPDRGDSSSVIRRSAVGQSVTP